MDSTTLDDWLNSLDLPSTQPSQQLPPAQPMVTDNSSNLSEEDVSDIISENGFSIPAFDNAEEVTVRQEAGNDSGEEVVVGVDTGYIRPQYIALSDDESTQEIPSSVNIPEDVASQLTAIIASNEDSTTEVRIDDDAVTEIVESYQSQTASDTPVVQEQAVPQPVLIPHNSPTLLIDDSTSRFSGAEWYEEIKRQDIILAGLGGIGSWTALQLARLAPSRITLYDDDVVDRTNMSGQFYSSMDAGNRKADSIAETIHKYTLNTQVFSITKRFTDTTPPGDIMICGFDNMEARKVFFESWCNHLGTIPKEDRRKCLFIDGRLSINVLQVLCITGDDVYNQDRYRSQFLFSDEEAEETICSLKQTTYLACMIGSFITNMFVNHVANLLDPVIPYDLPFFTEYDAQNVLFKTEN